MTAKHRSVKKKNVAHSFLWRIVHPKHPIEAAIHCVSALLVATYIMGSTHDGVVASALVAIDRLFRLIGNET